MLIYLKSGYNKSSLEGHTLLETLISAGIFILVAVALSGVWVMYGKALAKSSAIVTASAVARSSAEALAANGWAWLSVQKPSGSDEASGAMADVTIKRIVRAQTADITYKISYKLKFNPLSAALTTGGEPIFSSDICKISVVVEPVSGTEPGNSVNAKVSYERIVYKGAM